MNSQKLTRTLLKKAIKLNKKSLEQRGKPISHRELAEALNITRHLANNIKFIIENLETIKKINSLSFVTDDYSGDYKKILVIADLHIPLHDPQAIEIALSEGEKFKPDLIIILGDLIDFDEISHWNSSPPSGFDTKSELKLVKNFLVDLRHRFKKLPILFKYGNHEERLEKFIIKNAKEIYFLFDNLLSNALELDKLKIEPVEFPFHINNFWFLHGHEYRSRASRYIAAALYNRVRRPGLAGHFHRTDIYSTSSIDGEIDRFYVTACLQGKVTYSKVPAFEKGFATVEFKTPEITEVKLFRIVDGVVIL